MRGLMNIFSLGMDQLAAAIAGHGIDASVNNHAEADAVVSKIAARYRAGDHGPIILIGHSLGADAVMLMAQSLGPDGYTGCSGRSVRRHRFILGAEECRLCPQFDAARVCLHACWCWLSRQALECRSARRRGHRPLHDRQVAAAPGLCSKIGAGRCNCAIMSTGRWQLGRSQAEGWTSAACCASPAAWVRGLAPTSPCLRPTSHGQGSQPTMVSLIGTTPRRRDGARPRADAAGWRWTRPEPSARRPIQRLAAAS